jgi:photosystem II stability/assembly factor-like uncharacterized protein
MAAETTQLPDMVYALAPSPTFEADGVCFAARFSGLYHTRDGGTTWDASYASLGLETALTTIAVAVSPDFATDRSVFAGVSGGILRSFDGGTQWYSTVLAGSPVISALALSPAHARDGIVFAGTMEDGILRSGDRGSQWTPWNFGLLDLAVGCVAVSPDFATDETVYLGTSTGIFRSTNGGRAWREVNLPLDYEPVLSLAISPGYAQDGVLFAGTETHGLWSSADGGQSWERLGSELIPGPVNNILLSPTFSTDGTLLVNPGIGLLVSQDRGVTWASWNNAAAELEVAAVAAPFGLHANAPLLIGLVEHGVVRV